MLTRHSMCFEPQTSNQPPALTQKGDSLIRRCFLQFILYDSRGGIRLQNSAKQRKLPLYYNISSLMRAFIDVESCFGGLGEA